jgi:hypothetical protein
LKETGKALDLKPGTWVADKDAIRVCFDLRKGESSLTW